LDTGLEEFGPGQDGHDAAEAEEQERGDQVEIPDGLVVGSGHPGNYRAPEAAALITQTRDLRSTGSALGAGLFRYSHQFSAPSTAVGPWRSAACRRSYPVPRSPVSPAARRSAIWSSYSSWETTATLNNMSP